MSPHEQYIQFFRCFLTDRPITATDVSLVDDEHWTGFGAFARRHHICHFLIDHLERFPAESVLPSDGVETLRVEIARRAEAEQGVIAAMPRVYGALRAAGVRCLVLKGPVFAVRYFGDLGRRRQIDLDLLVSRDDIGSALTTLQEIGFTAKPRRLKRTSSGVHVRPQRLRTEHALVLSHDGVSVDLHWSLRTAPAYLIDHDQFWLSCQKVRVGDESYETLSDEHSLVLLLLSLAHDIGRGAGRLKHVLDVDRLLLTVDRSLDPETMLQRRVPEHTLSVVVNALDVCMRILDGRPRFPAWSKALQPYDSCLAIRHDRDVVTLLNRPKGDPENHRWFLRVYPTHWLRDSIWWIDRNVPHPARLLVASSKALRYTGRCLWRLAGQSPRSSS